MKNTNNIENPYTDKDLKEMGIEWLRENLEMDASGGQAYLFNEADIKLINE